MGNEVTVWGVHAGRRAEADSLFFKKRCVAVGWQEMGDVSTIAPDRESFKKVVAIKYPDKNILALGISTGQLYRFIHEMKSNDIVIYPSKIDKCGSSGSCVHRS